MTQSTIDSEVDDMFNTFLDEFVELTHTLRYKNDDLHLLPGDVKILREKMLAAAHSKLQHKIAQEANKARIDENMRWLEHCKLPDYMKAVDSVKVTDLIARNSDLQSQLTAEKGKP